MNKKQQALLFKITIVAVIILVAYFVFKSTRQEVEGKVGKRVGRDIAKEAGRNLFN